MCLCEGLNVYMNTTRSVSGAYRGQKRTFELWKLELQTIESYQWTLDTKPGYSQQPTLKHQAISPTSEKSRWQVCCWLDQVPVTELDRVRLRAQKLEFNSWPGHSRPMGHLDLLEPVSLPAKWGYIYLFSASVDFVGGQAPSRTASSCLWEDWVQESRHRSSGNRQTYLLLCFFCYIVWGLG